MLTHSECRNRLIEGVAQIGVLGVAAVACPPTCVHRELREIGEASDIRHAGYLARGQIEKFAEVGDLLAL